MEIGRWKIEWSGWKDWSCHKAGWYNKTMYDVGPFLFVHLHKGKELWNSPLS